MNDIAKEIQQNHQNVLDTLSKFEEIRKRDHTKAKIFSAFGFIFLLAAPLLFLLPLLVLSFFNFSSELMLADIFVPPCLIAFAALFYHFSEKTKKAFKSKLQNACLEVE